MWDHPFAFNIILGICAYIWLASGGTTSLSQEPAQMLKVGGFCLALCTLFLLVAWAFAAPSYGTTLAQLLNADMPSWQFRKTVYMFYAFVVCSGLCVAHAVIVWVGRILFGHARS
jgi:hypothetical protein